MCSDRILLKRLHLNFDGPYFPFQRSAQDKVNVGIRQPYLRVIGFEVSTEGPGRSAIAALIGPNEEEQMRQLAASPNIYERMAQSIAPSIYGSLNIKKAIACLLIGGSRKR